MESSSGKTICPDADDSALASLRRYCPVQVVRVRDPTGISISAMCSPSGY